MGVEDREDLGRPEDPATGIRVYSLYAARRAAPPPRCCGASTRWSSTSRTSARASTPTSTHHGLAMEEAAKRRIPLLRARPAEPDRRRARWRGRCCDAGHESFVGYSSAARAARHDRRASWRACSTPRRRSERDLRVVAMEGWQRGDWFDATGLPWVNPSPNMRSLTEALLLPRHRPARVFAQLLGGTRGPTARSRSPGRSLSAAVNWPLPERALGPRSALLPGAVQACLLEPGGQETGRRAHHRSPSGSRWTRRESGWKWPRRSRSSTRGDPVLGQRAPDRQPGGDRCAGGGPRSQGDPGGHRRIARGVREDPREVSAVPVGSRPCNPTGRYDRAEYVQQKVPSSFRGAGACAQNATQAGKFVVEHPTLLNLGFEWAIERRRQSQCRRWPCSSARRVKRPGGRRCRWCASAARAFTAAARTSTTRCPTASPAAF